MPIEPIMLDATLNTFRSMAKEINDKGLKGEIVDEMNTTLARMEELGQELDDYTDFSGRMLNENLYGKFSDFYGKALASEAQASQEESGYDDETLLKQTVNALKDAIQRIEDGKKEAIAEAKKIRVVEQMQVFKGMLGRGNVQGMSEDEYYKNQELVGIEKGQDEKDAEKMQAEHEANIDKHTFAHELDVDFKTQLLTEPIQKLIDLGEESGMTLPKFLTIQIEKGLDKAAQGTATSLEGIMLSFGYAKAQMISRIELEVNKAELDLFEKMISDAPFNVPNTKKFNILRKKIEHKHAPLKEEWNAIKSRWEKIIDYIELWIIASSRYYPSYMPWLLISDYNQQKELAEYIKDCYPGFIKVKLDNFKNYFNLSFEDIFKHETFIWDVENYHLGFSQEYLTFLAGPVYSECKPLAKASPAIISKFENHFHNQNRMANPESHKALERIATFYNNRYGEGRWEMKYGRTEIFKSNTSPWDLSSFNI